MDFHEFFDPNKLAAEHQASIGRMAQRGMIAKAERGELPGRASFGYRNVRTTKGTHIEIDRQAAPLVRRAFHLAANGLSAGQILAKLGKRKADVTFASP